MALLPSEKLRRLRERSPLEVDLSEEQTQRHQLGRRRSRAQRLLLILAVLTCVGFGLTVGYVIATGGGSSSSEGATAHPGGSDQHPADFSAPVARARSTEVDRTIARRFEAAALAQAGRIIQHALVASRPAPTAADGHEDDTPLDPSTRPRSVPDRPNADTSNRLQRAFDRLLSIDQYDPYVHGPE
jgi:hypothetical protein